MTAGLRDRCLAALVPLLVAATPVSGQPVYVDEAARAGLTEPTWCGRPEKPHILESNGAGLAILDYDLDGDRDLYLANGWRLAGTDVAEKGLDRLYRNRGDGTFDDVTAAAGLGSDGWSTGASVGDADGDGWPDLFVTAFGPDVLYRNRGDGTFEAIADGPGGDGWSTGAVFFDADGDGDEDLYVGGYIDCTVEEVLQEFPRGLWQGLRVMKGPFGLEGLANRYFENLGSGRFRDSTPAAGLTDAGLYYTFAVVATDLDGDLDPDLYAANDSNPNYLYRNDGGGHFEEMGLWSGAALDGAGAAQAGMGLAVADVDGDQRPDILVTNFWKDVSTLYRNLGELSFEDVTRAYGLDGPTYMPLSWGTAFFDADHDGDEDLAIANGHIYPQADAAPAAATSYRQRNLLLLREADRFVDLTDGAGPGFAVVESSRGLAVADLDGDGALELVISNVDAPPTLLRQQQPPAGAWLIADAPGAARAAITAGPLRAVRFRVAGGSFLSASDERFHFGLGEAERADLELLYADGRRRRLDGLPAGSAVVVPGR